MNFNFRTSGFAQLEQRLKQLSREDATKAGQSANRAGAAVLKKAVEKEAPVSNVAEGTKITRHTKGGKTREETHHKIKNNVKIKKSKAPGGRVENLVHIAQGYHASMVEFGSIHNQPNPFMLRALESNKDEIIAAIAKALNKGLIKRGV